MDLYEGSEVPDSQGELHVELTCGPYSESAPAVKVTEGRCVWYHVMKDMNITLPVDLTYVLVSWGVRLRLECGDVFCLVLRCCS
jgi:hypothetical protein